MMGDCAIAQLAMTGVIPVAGGDARRRLLSPMENVGAANNGRWTVDGG